MEVEFQLIAHLAASHCEDILLGHSGFNLGDLWLVIRSQMEENRACIRKLHPKSLEFFAVYITGGVELHLRRCLGHSQSEIKTVTFRLLSRLSCLETTQ